MSGQLFCVVIFPFFEDVMVTYFESLSDYEATFRALGIVGVMLYVGGFFCLSTGYINSSSPLYFALVLTAAACVLLSLQVDFNLSAALIQGFYIVMSLGGILVRWRRWRKSRKLKVQAQHLSPVQPAYRTPSDIQDAVPLVTPPAMRQAS
ncbi:MULTISPECIES: CBU_0592 family membrane protein [unclassified Marinovum]